MQVDEAALREVFLPPYQAAIEAGAQSIMVSFSSWHGVKMHAHQYLLTDVLKGELGFRVSWSLTGRRSTRSPATTTAMWSTSINAGLDMIMVPMRLPALSSPP